MAGFVLLVAAMAAGPPAAAQETSEQLLQRVNSQINNISTLELQDQLWQRPDTVVIDVCTPREILLPVFEHTDTGAWLETWETFEALGAATVVPGHGTPTDMAEVRRYTRDYLADLRAQIRSLIDDGGTLQDVYQVDQSAYAHLDTFDELARLNASTVFRAMAFE